MTTVNEVRRDREGQLSTVTLEKFEPTRVAKNAEAGTSVPAGKNQVKKLNFTLGFTNKRKFAVVSICEVT